MGEVDARGRLPHSSFEVLARNDNRSILRGVPVRQRTEVRPERLDLIGV